MKSENFFGPKFEIFQQVISESETEPEMAAFAERMSGPTAGPIAGPMASQMAGSMTGPMAGPMAGPPSPPVIARPLQNQQVQEISDVVFQCHITGNPRPRVEFNKYL